MIKTNCYKLNIVKFLLFIRFSILAIGIDAQNFKLSTYQVEQGLTTNLTKAIFQDKQGFVWIGTDVGVLRYDGYTFMQFSNNLASPYIKLFFQNRKGEFFVMHDMGIDQIENTTDSVRFKKFIPGSNIITDSTLFYPKSIYEDKEGNLWISEMYSIVKFKDGKIKRYLFDRKTTTSSFTRSFQCIEDGNGNLITFSQQGFLYFYDPKTDNFIEYKQKFQNITGVIKIDKGKLWVAAGDGILEFTTTRKGEVQSVSKALDFEGISTIEVDSANHLVYLGTWQDGVYKLSLKDSSKNLLKIAQLKYKVINDLFINPMGEVWISSDEGLALLYLSFFTKSTIALNTPFIQSITNSNGKMYITNGKSIWEIVSSSESYNAKELFVLHEEELILTISARNDILFFGTSRNNIYQLNLKTNELIKKDLSDKGGTIFYMLTDFKQNIWVCQQDANALIKIDQKGNYTYYGKEKGILNPIYVVKEKNNTIYCGGAGGSTYLYKLNEKQDKFINLSIKLPFEADSRFGIQDIAINSQNEFFLASNTKGLLKFSNNEIEKISLQQKETIDNIKAILFTKNDGLWIATDRGLILYYKNQFQVFDETNGLPSNTISYRSLAIDSLDNFWVGTSNGAGHTQKQVNYIQKTPTPLILLLKVNGLKVNNYSDVKKNVFVNNSFIHANFVSLIYPSKNITYQYRLVGMSEKWITINHNELTIPQIQAGKYSLEIRASKQGEYLWSDPFVFEFIIEIPWYANWWAILLFIVCFALFIWGIVKWNTNRLWKLKQKLESIIQNRTAEIIKQKEEITKQRDAIETKSLELEKAFEEIKALNATKDRFFSIIAHDLRGPLSSLSSFSTLMIEGVLNTSDIKTLGKQLNNAVKNTLDLTENLLTWARAQMNQSSFKPRNINLNDVLVENISLLNGIAVSKEIQLKLQVSEQINVWVDKDQLDFIMRNLISNSLKFTKSGGEITVFAKIRKDKFAEISIQDTGVGMPPEILNKIFNIDSNHSTKGTNGEKGTGLGLSLCKDFVNTNNGEIWAISELNVGSTFSFTLKLTF